MKTNLLYLLMPFIMVLALSSCSNNSQEDESLDLITDYNYSVDEIDLANRINNYRESVGKNRLELINHISYKSFEHNNYMIENNVVNHDYFESRANNIMKVLGAVRVGRILRIIFLLLTQH